MRCACTSSAAWSSRSASACRNCWSMPPRWRSRWSRSGVYGADALQSLRRATARILVAISLGVILLSVVFFISPPLSFLAVQPALRDGRCRCRALVGLRVLLGKMLGGHVFKRRVVVLGAGAARGAAQGAGGAAGIGVRRRRLSVDERDQPRHPRSDRARRDLQSRRPCRAAQRERSGAGAGGAAQRAAAQGPAADQDHRRPRQRNLDLPRARNRPRRSAERQPELADLFRRLFVGADAVERVQAAVRHRRQRCCCWCWSRRSS